MIIWCGIGLDLLALIVGLVLCTLGYRWARQDGYQAGLSDGHADRAQQELDRRQEQRHEARHARVKPRQHPDPDRTPPTDPAPLPPDPADAQPDDIKPPWYTEQLPGPGRPQAARDSGPGTATLPRYGSIGTLLEELGVRPRLGLPATTGEMAAVTDQYIEDMAAEEAAYRENLVS